MPSEEDIPLFPLHTVLFPGGPLPLRIFEPRYVDMVRQCLREETSFGVVLIYSGNEAGAVDDMASVGTSARIVDFQQMPDGLLGILCVGERRFRVSSSSRRADGSYVGTIAWLPPEPKVALPPEYAPLAELLRRVLPGLGSLHSVDSAQYEDAAWVGCRLAEILPASLADKQYCLELDDPLARLARLAPLVNFRA